MVVSLRVRHSGSNWSDTATQPDPYVRVYVNGTLCASTENARDLAPRTWAEFEAIPLRLAPSDRLEFVVVDRDTAVPESAIRAGLTVLMLAGAIIEYSHRTQERKFHRPYGGVISKRALTRRAKVRDEIARKYTGYANQANRALEASPEQDPDDLMVRLVGPVFSGKAPIRGSVSGADGASRVELAYAVRVATAEERARLR